MKVVVHTGNSAILKPFLVLLGRSTRRLGVNVDDTAPMHGHSFEVYVCTGETHTVSACSAHFTALGLTSAFRRRLRATLGCKPSPPPKPILHYVFQSTVLAWPQTLMQH